MGLQFVSSPFKLSLLAVISLGFALPNTAFAAKNKKNNGNSVVAIGDTYSTDVSYEIGKKKKKKEVTFSADCYGEKAGKVKSVKGKLMFTSFAQEASSLKKKAKLANKRGNKKAAAKLRAKAAAAAKRNKAAVEICRKGSSGGGGEGGGPIPTAESLAPYTGTWGYREASIFHHRFTFGATSKELDATVTNGLEATLNNAMSWKNEPILEEQARQWQCNRRFANDENYEECDPFDVNDFSLTGFVESMYHILLYTKNPLHYRMFYWAHDERGTLGLDNVDNDERYAVRTHFKMLQDFAKSGDFKSFAETWHEDHMVSLRYLDRALNDGTNPNENEAREFWELNTTSPDYCDSNNEIAPVYGPLDIAQSALATSGWTFADDEQEINSTTYTRIVKAFSPVKFAEGQKIVFIGTPYEAVIEDSDDLVEATFQHPAVAQHVAEELIKEFIQPFPSCAFIKRVASLITEHNFNLYPVVRTLALSEAAYASENEKTLIKLPLNYIIGFLRSTQYPVSSYNELNDILGDLGHRPFYPNSIFGWNSEALASDANTILHWNGIARIMKRTYDVTNEDPTEKTYNFYTNLVYGLDNVANSDEALIARLSHLLGVYPTDTAPIVQ
ncbi:MAG: DUF1800 family protein, partial [Bdellovibrionales bacterium]|nr:DUF1800 family protein [Bdellovibrionales bacterium]